MNHRRLRPPALLLALLALACDSPAPAPKTTTPARTLRVCSDPNNLPFSNADQQGFENKLAALFARELGARIEYKWWPQRRGFVRNTLRAKECDVIVGVPSAFELAATTRPYYRSTYVFVSRKDRNLRIESFDDQILKKLTIGVQLIGDDGANAPPAHALAARGIVDNVRGYTLYGDYRQPNPPARIIEAVARREIDVAIVWGPLAGWAARQQRVPLQITPVTPEIDVPFLPFVYDIAVGVRREDERLRVELDRILERRKPEIDRILADYGVPRVDADL